MSKPDRASLAFCEFLRRVHCDRRGQDHPCHGTTKVIPGMVILDCSLCGTCTESTKHLLDLSDEELVLLLEIEKLNRSSTACSNPAEHSP